MTLIKSISGIRGTVGGIAEENLTPLDCVKYTSAYGQWLKQTNPSDKLTVLVGRDARLSGNMFSKIVSGTLMGMGIHVIDLDLTTTPTIEMAVTHLKSNGAIMLTASHNPIQWNALKLFNYLGEFISEQDGLTILNLVEKNQITYTETIILGNYTLKTNFFEHHISEILKLKYVDVQAIKAANFTICLDAINSTGGIIVPILLEQLGVKNVIKIHCEAHGHFAHNPEPLAEHLTDLSNSVITNKAHVGISVDPDVDRLALVCEDGTMFGEEYTLVAVADAVLKHHKNGNTVSNLSSTSALKDVTLKNGGSYAASAVGEVHVVTKMKETNAVIGGEGNGGVILPELHYGRDALVGIALFLTHLAKSKLKTSELKKQYPIYVMSKNKIELTPQTNIDSILNTVKAKYASQQLSTIDGLKITFKIGWVHLRKSNTEPIIRIYSEHTNQKNADNLANEVINFILL